MAISRPKKVERSQKGYMTNEKYQDYAENQFQTIYDYLDSNIGGKVLYQTHSTGFNTGSHTIKENINNFDEFEVFFRRSNNIFSSGKIRVNSENIARCVDFGIENMFLGRLSVLESVASWLSSKVVPIGGGTLSNTTDLYCVRIVGYKY